LSSSCCCSPACSPPAASSCAAAPNCPGYKLPFATIALGLDPTTEFHALLKRSIEAQSPGTRVVADARRPRPCSACSATRSEKNILSLTAAGRAREYPAGADLQLPRAWPGYRPGRCRRRK
jgi:hypothetical protein